MKIHALTGAIAGLLVSSTAFGSLTVNYTEDLGGNNTNPINGLAAQADWAVNGNQLTITMINSSTGVPSGAEASDSLLVSLAFDLGSLFIVSGDSAVIGAGSNGIGSWAGMQAGDSVAEQWLWTNDAGGDLLEAYANVISTSNGQGGGTETGFDGTSDPDVSGPYGGIAADPVLVNINSNQEAVSDSITFTLTLSGTLSDDELAEIANAAVVEFGSDYQYLGTVPAPASLALIALGIAGRRRRRQA